MSAQLHRPLCSVLFLVFTIWHVATRPIICKKRKTTPAMMSPRHGSSLGRPSLVPQSHVCGSTRGPVRMRSLGSSCSVQMLLHQEAGSVIISSGSDLTRRLTGVAVSFCGTHSTSSSLACEAPHSPSPSCLPPHWLLTVPGRPLPTLCSTCLGWGLRAVVSEGGAPSPASPCVRLSPFPPASGKCERELQSMPEPRLR